MALVLRPLGKSDIKISPIGLGCWQFSQGNGVGGKFWESLPQEQINQIVKASLDGGINWFDTAEIYGWGKSETALVNSLAANGRKPGDVVIATKWYPVGRNSSSIIKTFPARVEALKNWPIDLHQVHMPWGLSTRSGEMKAMAKLLREQKIKTVGVSNFSASQLRKAHKVLKDEGFDLVSNQVRYNLVQRYPDFDGTMAVAKELGITIIAFSPLAQGLLTGKFHEDPNLIRSRTGYRKYMPMYSPRGLAKTLPLIEELRKLATAYSTTPAQVALNWLLTYNGDTVVAIPGATKTSHAEQNVGAMAFELTRAECTRLDELSR
ncbi:MAG: aldo/keto reductase [Spirochaetes bacterium]|nr:aldo/keto reductase [Spirochaetota bacterium]MBU0954181.1 aldo/keto reductase [Spirochaetota bacterium]